MIMIKKEDQPKIIVLGVALVGVVGFVGFRASTLLGQKKPMVAQARDRNGGSTNVAPEDYEETPVYSALPSPNEANPFRDVLIDRKNQKTAKLPKPTALPGVGLGGISPMPISGDFEVKPIATPPLRLDGVVAGRQATAIVTLGETTDVLSVGRSIGEYTLVSVDSRSAAFASKRGSVRLLVGEEHKPPPPVQIKPPTLPPVAGLMQ
jgi:hypothetical protein